MNSDSQLVMETLAGERSSYDELTRRWSVRVCSYVASRVRNSHVTEELAQEAFLKAFRSLGSLENHHKFGSWLLSIAHRLVLDWSKAKARTEVQLGDHDRELNEKNDRESPSVKAESDEVCLLLQQQINELPDNLRQVLLMFYYDNVTYREIAEALGISVATVNARLSRARRMLRERVSFQEVRHEL